MTDPLNYSSTTIFLWGFFVCFCLVWFLVWYWFGLVLVLLGLLGFFLVFYGFLFICLAFLFFAFLGEGCFGFVGVFWAGQGGW